MQVKLVVVDGDAKNSEIKLRLPAVIGRGRGSTLQIPQALVSRRHCEITLGDGKLKVRDLGSLNGTFVDGQKVNETELLPGHLLTIGTMTFRADFDVELDADSAPTAGARDDATRPSDRLLVEPVTPVKFEETTSLNAGEADSELMSLDADPAANPSTILPSTIDAPKVEAAPEGPAAAEPDPASAAADDDDEDLRAFFKSLGK